MIRAIRPIAICVLRRHDEILVIEGRDESRDLTFYRPLGGGIEFGEGTVTLPAVWRRLSDFDMVTAPLYPDGSLACLTDP